MGEKTGLASLLLALLFGYGIYIIITVWVGVNGFFASWFWRRSHEFGNQHRIGDSKFGLFGFVACVIKATSPILLILILILIICLGLCASCLYLLRREISNKKKDIRISKGQAICVAVILGIVLIILLSGIVTVNSLLLACLNKWLPHFKARGESSNAAGCIALIVLLSLELALFGALLLASIVLLAIGICVLVFMACSRKKGWTWNEFHDTFKHRSKIDLENRFERFIGWCGRHWWGKKLHIVPREENSPVPDQTDSQGV